MSTDTPHRTRPPRRQVGRAVVVAGPLAGAFGLANQPAHAVVALVTQVSSSLVTVGTPFTDTATLSGGINPTGSITFRLYGPNDSTCAGAPSSLVVPVSGNGSYMSPPSPRPLRASTTSSPPTAATPTTPPPAPCVVTPQRASPSPPCPPSTCRRRPRP